MKNWFKNLNILLLLCALVCVSNTVWGAQTHTGYTAVAQGKGTATVKIYYRKYMTDADDKRTGAENSTTGSSLVSASYSRGNTQDGSIAFYAAASEGYYFAGWYGNAACSGEVLSTDSWPYWAVRRAWGNDSKIAFAKFAPISYDVTLSPNGGSGSNQVVYAAYETAMPTSLKDGGAIVKPTKSGYVFAGYFDATSGGTKYYNSDLTSAHIWDKTSATTLYAQWVDKLTPSITCNQTTLKVDEQATGAFSFTNTDGVTWAISNVSINAINNGNGKVIEYDATNNKLIARNAGTARITFTQSETSSIKSGEFAFDVTVSKHTPVFTWNAGGTAYYHLSSIPGIFSTTNTDFGYTIVSDKSYSANVIDNTLYIYNVEEAATFTATQVENYKWEGKVQNFVVSPVDQNNHVPFTITSSNYNTPFHYNHSGSFSYNTNGVQVGDGGGGFNWDDKYYDIAFTGIPDKLSFEYETASGAAYTGVEWWVKESADGTTWVDSKWGTKDNNSGTASNIQLLPTTRYLRFCYSGNFGGRFKNINVTELNQFSATPALVDFGTKGINFGTQEETVIFNHANAGRITTMEIVEADAEYFSIERSTIPGTGRDLYATTNIVVSFDNKKGPAGHEPAYSAVLHIEDNAGHCLNIPLSGVRDGKTEPEFSFNANHLPYFVGTNIANVASSSNTDYANCPLTFETSDASIAQVIDGTLHIYNKKESVTITIRQGENKDFSAGVAYFTFTPRERPERAVPMQLVKSIYNEGTVEAGSKCKWLDDDGGCIRVGNNNAVVDDWIWYNSEKNFTIAFDGTPGRLSFEYKNTAWLVTPDADHYTYEVQESSDGGTWHTIWYTDATTTEWTAVKEVTLNPSTRYLRFSFSGNYWGFYRNINISELVGYKYLRAESDGRYLSRGALWGTQAIVDDFGMACRISNYTNDNTNFYTRFLFVDNQQYLYEADNHEMYTDDGTAANTYNLWKQNVVDGTIITFQSGNAYPGDSRKGQYITLNGDALALTADAAAATRWQMEDYTEHEAYITAMMDREAAAAAAKDFGSSINTLAKVRTEIAENDFEMTHIDIPALALGEQKGEYRSGVAGTNAVYDNTISGLVPGFYRLTVKAFYRISSSDIAWTCHAAGMESVLAYIYANSVEYPLQSLYNSYHVSPLEASDELRGGHYYSTDLTSAGEAFEDEKRYLNDVYVYVPADEGLTTGTLRYGIKNPSYVPGAWLTYKDITLTRIARKEYIFEGTFVSDKENWEVGGNWNRESVPNEHHAVIIRSDVVIGDEVKAYSLAVENDAKVIVAPTGGLTIGAGGVKGTTTENFILKAGQEGATKGQTGYLRVSPYSTQPMPQATVELFSVGYYDYNAKQENIAKWQYVGSPLASDEIYAKTIYKKSWVYGWDESADAWTNQRASYILRPFVGFATTQRTSANGMLLSYAGQLVSNKTNENIALAYSGERRGHNVLANSFSAPIDITKFEDRDFRSADSVIYIFNTGSRAEADSLIAKKSYDVNAPGQYLAIPIGSARLLKGAFGMPTVIAPMQGFCVHAHKDDAQITLDYSKLVWDGNYEENPNTPARVSAHKDVEETHVGNLQVSLYTDGGIDYLFMLESDQFDALYESGFDARKLMGDELNIFSIQDDEMLAVDATNSIIGTRVGVRTGDETAYTFVFGKMRSENELALFDAETSETIDINEGTEYTFFAEPNSMIMDRFQIIERDNAPAITTDIDNVENETKAHKFIKNNQLYILKNGVLYSATGAVVR